MKPKLSLTTRAFLLAFFPICLMLAASFFTINAILRAKIKVGLKESLRRTERTLDVAKAAYDRRNMQLLAVVSEDSGLKAGINLLREVPYGDKPQPQVLNMVKDQLHAVAGVLDYDFLVLNDADGQSIAGFMGKSQEIPLNSISPALGLFPLINLEGNLYEATNVPINLGSENLGSLILGKKFDIGSLNSSGYAALLHDQKILLTNFPQSMVKDVGDQLQKRCAGGKEDCEVRAGVEDYLAVRVQKAALGENLQLYTFQSIDAAMNEFTRGFKQAFLLIGVGGVLIVLLLSLVGSRSLSKPLTDLIAHLSEGEKTGKLLANFSTNSSLKEVDRLAQAFNRAAGAIQESQGHLEEAVLQFVETMAEALDARDQDTAGHSNRVSVNSTAIAATIGLPPDEIEIIRIGAKLHDIGKIGVPDAVLQKPGRLTEEEFALIRLHPQIGKRILEKVARFQDYLPIVELHHEDYNGGGYPHGLKGKDVPIGVRIVHVADVYDAITSNRAYRKAMPEQQVMEIMTRGSGKQFDPVVLEAFFKMLDQRKLFQGFLEQANAIHAYD